jgi:hypothetical protein
MLSLGRIIGGVFDLARRDPADHDGEADGVSGALLALGSFRR